MFYQLLIAIGLATLAAVLAWYKKWLDAGGSLAAMLLGTIVWLAGGWQTALPMLLFFISGSILSLAQGRQEGLVGEKDNRPRDFVQVCCNGGIAGLALIVFLLTNRQEFLYAYWLSIAISTSDTWSSGIGIKYGGKVVDIKNGRRLAKGLSGGVSIQGTIGGFAGALVIGFAGFLIYTEPFPILLVTLGGFAGMLTDSLLGSFWQAKYRLGNGKMAEFIPTGEKGKLAAGLPWMTNDWVNLLSNCMVTSATIWLYFIYQLK